MILQSKARQSNLWKSAMEYPIYLSQPVAEVLENLLVQVKKRAAVEYRSEVFDFISHML